MSRQNRRRNFFPWLTSTCMCYHTAVCMYYCTDISSKMDTAVEKGIKWPKCTDILIAICSKWHCSIWNWIEIDNISLRHRTTNTSIVVYLFAVFVVCGNIFSLRELQDCCNFGHSWVDDIYCMIFIELESLKLRRISGWSWANIGRSSHETDQ